MTEGRTWALRLPYGRPPLSLNRSLHPKAAHRLKKRIKSDTHWIAKAQRIPRLEFAEVLLVWHKMNNCTADADNIAATLKPALDGLVAAGVFVDDDGRTVCTGQRITYPGKGKRRPYDVLELRIRELTEMPD